MFKWLTGRREAKSSSLDLLRAFVLGSGSASGQAVNSERALGVTTVLRCATVLGNGCSQIPFKLYRSVNDGRGREVVTDHPVSKLIGRRPNTWQTPSEWRRTATMHAALEGFHLSIVTRSTVGGEPIELLPVPPSWVDDVKQESDWKITYTVRFPDGRARTFDQSEVFVLRGPSWDGVKGLGVVRYAREAIGLRMAVDESQARLFANGARPGGILTSKAPLDEEQRAALKGAWDAMHSGSSNSGRSALLEGDLEWKPLAFDNTDAETMALRGQQIEEICRAFGVFPQMVGYAGDKSPTYASAEQFFINHVVHTLQPWHVAWEEAMATQLLSDEEWSEGLYFKFTVQALLRGTAKERGDFYKSLIDMGVASPNEIRAWEEMDERPELARYRIPLAMTVIEPDGRPFIPAKDAPPQPAAGN